MDRCHAIMTLSHLLRRHLLDRREQLVGRIDWEMWDPELSRELEMHDEALTRLGYYDHR